MLPESCPTACRFVTDLAAFEDADAVVFHVPTLGNIGHLPKRRGQLWVAYSMESRVMCPALDDPTFMSRFDLTMTYERTSDVWHPYFGPGTVPGLTAPVAPRTAASPVVYLQSNVHDLCGRFAYVGELMDHVAVDSFGPVHRNKPDAIPPGHPPRIDLYSKYKFTLAFENSFTRDYVTEKLFEPLTAGSVPVYRGCEEVAELAPAPDCYIDARHFRSAADLGAYLRHLDADEEEYRSFHTWRTRPFRPAFTQFIEQLRDLPFCRLAAVVEARTRRADGPRTRRSHRTAAVVPALWREEENPSQRPGVGQTVLLRPGTFDESIWTGVALEYPTIPERFRPGEIVLDIGCHTGSFCRMAAERGATVVGYEASRDNHALACINLAGQPSVTLKNAAVGRSDVESTSVTFTPSPERSNTGGGSVLFESEEAHAAAGLPWHRPDPTPIQPLTTHDVPVVGLDDILTELGRVRFLKIDVEGAEYPILLTARRLDLVDAIGGEYHELGTDELAHVAPELRTGLDDWSPAALRRALEAAGFAVTFRDGVDAHGIFHAERTPQAPR